MRARLIRCHGFRSHRSLRIGSLPLITVWGMLMTPVLGQGGVERLFDEANVFYQRQDFAAALEKYLQIESQGQEGSALYYNIANCYYRLGQIGKAILNYERAAKLDPADEDIRANLQIANQATVDKIDPPSQFALARWVRAALYLLPFQTIVRLIVSSYLGITAMIMVLILTRHESVRSNLRRLLIVASIGFTVALCLAGLQWWDSKNRIEAIVQLEQISAFSSPDNNGVEVFTIHEGTKVRIEGESQGWVEIILPDGKVGWVSADSVEII